MKAEKDSGPEPDAHPVRGNCLAKFLNVVGSRDVARTAEVEFGHENWPEIVRNDSAD
jgi:hypothetical protein